MTKTKDVSVNGRLSPSGAMPAKTRRIELEDPNLSALGLMEFEIQGVTGLIVHRFGEKARQMMLDAQTGKAKAKKAPKVPENDFLDALHVIGPRPKTVEDLATTRFAVPAVCFKAAAVRAAKAADMAMTDARLAFFVQPDWSDLVEIFSPNPPEMRIDPVRVQNTADLRVRPMFDPWSAKVRVSYNARLLSAEQLTSFFVYAGQAVGIGDWRPAGRSSTGVYGTFKLVKAIAHEPDLSGAR